MANGSEERPHRESPPIIHSRWWVTALAVVGRSEHSDQEPDLERAASALTKKLPSMTTRSPDFSPSVTSIVSPTWAPILTDPHLRVAPPCGCTSFLLKTWGSRLKRRMLMRIFRVEHSTRLTKMKPGSGIADLDPASRLELRGGLGRWSSAEYPTLSGPGVHPG